MAIGLPDRIQKIAKVTKMAPGIKVPMITQIELNNADVLIPKKLKKV
ncbi:hypothetical protein CP8484711_1163, partial [Chlamydia psittaci 84-8471/1]